MFLKIILEGISKGKEAKVFFPVLGDTIISKIRQTGNFINPSNRAFSVEIPVPNKKGNIKPNLSARVSLNDYSSDNAILVPQGIISENADGAQYVYVASEPNGRQSCCNKTDYQRPEKLKVVWSRFFRASNAGDLLIKEGARTVKEGQNVQILNTEGDE